MKCASFARICYFRWILYLCVRHYLILTINFRTSPLPLKPLTSLQPSNDNHSLRSFLRGSEGILGQTASSKSVSHKGKVFKVPEGHHPRAQPSARLSKEICLSEGSQGPFRGSLRGFCGVSAGLCGGLRNFPRVVTPSL